MGNTTLLDILCSLTTFGLLLLAVLRLNGAATENNYAYSQNYLLQRNMVVITTLLEDDLKHVGSGIYDADGGIQYADTNDLRYTVCLNPRSTTKNTVEWKLEATAPPNTQNPNIRYISRTVDGVTSMMNLGVTRFVFKYWSILNPDSAMVTPINSANNPNPCGNIGPVSVMLTLESSYKMNQSYMNDTSQYAMVWRQLRSISRNNSLQFPQ